MLRHVLATAAAFYPPLDTGDAAVAAWTVALTTARVTNLGDAKAAVVAYYSSPSHDPWIRPGHVIAGVDEIRTARRKAGPNLAEISRDLDPDDPAWARIVAERMDAVADGRPLPASLRSVGGQ